ncbi:hypothetical protein V1278_000377 [Bradyrhizobium sp. AZCC 1577]
MQGIQKPGFGRQVPSAQKESIACVSRKMMHGRAAVAWPKQAKAAGIV